MTDKLVDQKSKGEGEKAYVLGTIIKEPERKTSRSGNGYTKVLVSTGPELWNLTVMDPLRAKLPDELFAKFRYAKFGGTATHREYEKDGQKKVAHDMLVNMIELQDGTKVYEKERKNDDEDAPF